MFTTFFVGYSAIVGGVLTISYAGRALMEAGLAFTRGKTTVTDLPNGEGQQEHYTPPSLGLAAKTLLTEATVPLVAMGIGVEEMCRSARDVAGEARRGASHLLQRMNKRTSAPTTVDGVATPSVPVTPDHVDAVESTLNLQPA